MNDTFSFYEWKLSGGTHESDLFYSWKSVIIRAIFI